MNSLTTYILRRLLLFPITLVGITVVVFLLVRLAPGDPVAAHLGDLSGLDPGTAQAARAELEARLHLNDPLPTQYLYWLAEIRRTGLGVSSKHHRPITELVAERLPVTVGLNLCAFVITYALAIPLGLLSGVQHNRPTDRIISMVSLGFYSLPPVFVGTMFLVGLAHPDRLNWFPAAHLHSGGAERLGFFAYLANLAWHAVLPVATMSYAGYAYLAKQVRAGLLDNLRQDYVRTARAKGLSRQAVLLGHVLPNSLTPLITIMATLLPAAISGSVIVETIFSVPGMGQLLFESLLSRDFAVVQAVTMLSGFLNMTGLLLADIAYALVDPRISYD